MPRTRPVLASFAIALLLSGLALSSVAATYPGDVGRLAYAVVGADGNVDIYSVLPNGHEYRQLTSDPGFDACPAYSADGKQIAFCSGRTGPFEIWAMGKTGANQRQVTHLGGFAIFPDWSPDGARIAFSGGEGTDPNDEIYTVDAASGGGLAALTSCAGFGPGCFNDYPAYSPDGTTIAFIHADDRDTDGNPINEQVWVMNADGSARIQLTFDAAGHDEVPDWSPDGTRIAYEDGDLGNGRIFVMHADGSGQEQLTFGPGDDFGPVWSPDGARIAFVRDFGTFDRPVMVMDANGSNQHAVHPGGRQLVPAWQPLGGSDGD
jgi:TolB protein